MNNDDVNSRYPLDGGIIERFNAMSKSKAFRMWDKIINETILSWHPNLTEKELDICNQIFGTIWDLKSGNSAMYDELVARLVEGNTFANENEIGDVIKHLISKSVLEAKQEIWIFGATEKSIKVLAFTEEDLYKELQRSACEYFGRVTDAFFNPTRKSD